VENLWVIAPIPLDHAIRLCNVDKFSLFSFSGRGFLGVLKTTSNWDVTSPHFMEALLNEIGETIKDEVVKEILREEKNSLRAEKKRAWSPKKTKAPFYDRARYKSKINSFQAALDLAVTIALLCKHFFALSFERLRDKLIENNYDCRKTNKKNTGTPVPCKSELHWALLKVPKEYFEEAKRLIDEGAADLHGNLFGTDELNKFSRDGTSNQCDELEEALIACKPRLRRKTDKINALVRLVTNTISEISSSEHENQKDLRKLLEKRKA